MTLARISKLLKLPTGSWTAAALRRFTLFSLPSTHNSHNHQPMRRARITFWLSLLTIAASSCRTPPPPPAPLPVRFADNYQVQVVYLSPTVALARTLKVVGNDTQAFFALGRAHWEPPALTSDTGDHFEDKVKGTISRVGLTASGAWLLAESEDYDFEKHKAVAYVTAVQLASGKLHSAGDATALRRELNNDPDLATAKLEPVELFFERALITRLRGEK
jgi:hypothetical protein